MLLVCFYKHIVIWNDLHILDYFSQQFYFIDKDIEV